MEPLPPPPVIPEPTDTTPTAAYHKAFMSAKPLNFKGTEGSNKAEKWIREIEKSFNVIEVPERLKDLGHLC